MEDDKGFQYGRRKIYKERVVLYCLNNKRKLKCPGIVKTEDQMSNFEAVASHNNACSMQCLRRRRNLMKTELSPVKYNR